MKVKRKVAALLALAMVLTGQPSGVLAGAMPGDGSEASTKVVSDKIATPPKATPDEPENELRAKVEYTILPEDGAHILNGATTKVKSGDTLKFSFVVKDDYELSSVNVDGDSDGVKISVDESDEDKYHCEYNVGDIVFDTTQVEIALTEASEEESFSTVLTEDGLIFTITADAGVLPEGTEAEIISLEEAADIDADAVKEEVLNMADVAEEEDSQYAAYRIEFVDAEGELLADEDINGEVNVSVTAAEDEEAEIAEVYKVEVVSESEENEADEPQIYNIEEESESDKADVESTAVQTKPLLKAKSRKVVKPIINAEEVESDFEIGSSVYNLAVVKVPLEQGVADAYFYIVRANFAQTEEMPAGNEAFIYVGKGKIKEIPPENVGDTGDSTRDNIRSGQVVEEPDFSQMANKQTSQGKYDSKGYPILTLTVDGTEQKYYSEKSQDEEAIESDYKYSFNWEEYVCENGAPDGNLADLADGKPTWHVDGRTILIDPTRVQIDAYIKGKDAENFNQYEESLFVNINTAYKNSVDEYKAQVELSTEIPNGYNAKWYINNPSNKGGIVYSFESLKKIINKAAGKDGVKLYCEIVPGTVGYTVEYKADNETITSEESFNDAPTKGTGEFNSIATLSEDQKNRIPKTINLNETNYMLDPGNTYSVTLDNADGNNVIVVKYVKDANKDKKPDANQITVTFDLDDQNRQRYGATFTDTSVADGETVIYDSEEGTLTYWLTKGKDRYPTNAPEVKSNPESRMAFDGWYPAYNMSGAVGPNDNDQMYNATYDTDKFGGGEDGEKPDEIPDKYQVKITYTVVNGSWSDGSKDAKTEVVTFVDGDGNPSEEGMATLNAPTGIPNSGYTGGTWCPSAPTTVTKDDPVAYTLTYTERSDVPYTVEYYYDGVKGEATEENAAIATESTAKYNTTVTITPAEKVVYNGENHILTSTEHSVLIKVDTENVITVQYKKDANGDGVPDTEQTHITLQPYETSIYRGGTNSDNETTGLPDLELGLVNSAGTDIERPVVNSRVKNVTINGKKFEATSLDDYFKAIYVYRDEKGNYQIINSDAEGIGKEIISVVAVRAAAFEAFPAENYSKDESRDLIVDKSTGRFVTVNTSDAATSALDSIGINADTENGAIVDYFVEAASGKLFVREVNNYNENVYRDIVDSDAEAMEANRNDLAAAMPEVGTKFYTNGDEKRAQAEPEDVRLLVDDVKEANNRQKLLADKAYTAAYGLTSEQAEAEGYDSELKFLDLVDTGNGNAWVESSEGTYVFWPYPDGTDKNTEFTLRHFVGLDRETQYDGDEAVANAIAGAELEDEVKLKMVPTEEGLKFFTDEKLAFSPFMLMWKTDDGNGNGGNDNPGGGGGNDHDSTTGGSGTVADPYVVRLHGNWVHMDPNDIFKPISEPVPEGATPVTNPEWHQWKFILNNGTMLFNRWAYIRNPYAVGDQPREGWFYFNRDGIMQYGWYRDEATGKWYYAHRESDGMLGTLRYGWHHDDQDGKWYYLDPTTGEMLLGWRQIDGKWYYFNPYAPEVTWNYNEATGGWTYNGSASRPYGSMYQNEMTPDGYQVDENGAWVQ